MRQRQNNEIYQMMSDELPIVTLDALTKFSENMKDQNPNKPPPGKRKRKPKVSSEVKIEIDSDPELDLKELPRDEFRQLSLNIESYRSLQNNKRHSSSHSRAVPNMLIDDLPTRRNNKTELTIRHLYERYAPTNKKHHETRTEPPEEGIIHKYDGEVELNSLAIVFTVIEVGLVRKMLWAWRLDKWPVDVYIEFTGNILNDSSRSPIYLCFGLDDNKSVPRMIAYRNPGQLPNPAAQGATKVRLPLSNTTHIRDLYGYCAEMSNSNNTQFAYVNRAEDFCERNVPCCGELLAAAFRSWASKRVPTNQCLNQGCLPITHHDPYSVYNETGGDIWTASRLIHSVMWTMIFERYRDYCSKCGITERPPASLHAFFQLLVNMKNLPAK